MSKVTIGTCTLGTEPRIAVVIDRLWPVSSAVKLRGADLLEIRVDRINAGLERILRYVERLRAVVHLPLIGTIRQTAANRRRRLDMYHQLLPLVDCVDIEIDSPENRAVISAARKLGCRVIVSEHNFEETPSEPELRRIVVTAKRLGADIVKIAAMARKREDVTRLLRLCEDAAVPMVVISMGSLGVVSRIVGPLFGSLFTYACLDKPVAPGQVPFSTLVRLMRVAYGGY